MSLCYSSAEREPHLYACLLLKAVFPAFADLFNEAPTAREGLESANFSLRLQTTSGLRSTLRFGNGSCCYLGEEKGKADIVLHFLSNRLAAPHLEGRVFAMPMPIRGVALWRQLRSFMRLSKLLERYLKGGSQDAASNLLCGKTQSWLTLGVCLRAAVQLSRHERFSRRHARDLPDGYAEFHIAESNRGGWIRCEKGKLSAGSGATAEPARVRILFPNAQTALDALNDRIDLAAAAGAGTIRVEGYLPLADGLGVLFDRVPAYLKT